MKKIIALLVSISFLCGCATILRGTTQRVYFNVRPAGALVDCGGQKVVAPGYLTLSRCGRVACMITKEGYKPVTVTLEPKMDIHIAGNIIFGGVIGGIVDSANCSARKLEPSNVDVTLDKE